MFKESGVFEKKDDHNDKNKEKKKKIKKKNKSLMRPRLDLHDML